MIPKSLSPSRGLALINETETTAFLLVEGLQALKGLTAANDFAHLPMLLLSQGFERMLKIVLSLARFESRGKFPSKKELRRWGHNLHLLLDDVLVLFSESGYGRKTPAIRNDMEFLLADELLHSSICLMGGFGERGRYFNLDAVVNEQSGTENPQDAFNRLETMILDRHPHWKTKFGSNDFSGFYPVLAGDLVEVHVRAARALSRPFVFDLLGDTGRQVSPAFHEFYIRDDDDLRRPPKRWFEPY